MRAKPRGKKYRNLTARAGVIYYERVIDGKRTKRSTHSDDWDQAAETRDLFEKRREEEKERALVQEAPTLRAFAQRYLDEDTSHLAPTTKRDRKHSLRKDGPLLAFFGDTRLDEITPAALREWWGREIERRKFTLRTGRGYVDVLSSVLGYARDLELVTENPIPAFREQLRRRSRTQKARAEAEAGRTIHPIDSAKGLRALVEAAEAEA